MEQPIDLIHSDRETDLETELNDSFPCRELEMDELKDVSGGADDGTFWDHVIAGLHANSGTGGTSGGTPGGIQAGANAALNQLGIK